MPFCGDYFAFRPEVEHLCRNLIYPVPDPRFPFLGVHATRRPDGQVWAGPNAVLALAREGYRRRDVDFGDLWEIVRSRPFHRFAKRYRRIGAAELYRDSPRARSQRPYAAICPRSRSHISFPLLQAAATSALAISSLIAERALATFENP
ncbi:MAG: hypothetical protein H0V94_00460 [Actinobacteria bacterium]|nr:hypothetical protein [Actinomycetota bacterium]